MQYYSSSAIAGYNLVTKGPIQVYTIIRVHSAFSLVASFVLLKYTPLTYTYLDCLLDVKMRGHKMAEI